jgi:RNA polymerase-associated protein CTR9
MDEPMDMERTPSPVLPGRSIDIELGGAQEVITIDLDNLDPNPDDVLELLKEGNCKVWMWTKLAGEYWRRGWLDAAERLALAGVDRECQKGRSCPKFA